MKLWGAKRHVILKSFMCMVVLCLHVCLAATGVLGVRRCQKKASDSLGLELQIVESIMDMLGTELRSSGRSASTHNTEPFL